MTSVSSLVVNVSVVIPTYNRRALLERALASVLAQSHPAREIIVVDDGSNDGTGEFIAARYPQVRYFYQENRGVSSARNCGIKESAGEWIALLDSDDEWKPQKLARQSAALDESPGFDLCHCDEDWVRAGVRVNQGARHGKGGGYIFRSCLPLCVISPSAAMLRRTVFAEIGLFDEDLPACEDYDFWLRFCSRRPVLFVDESLVIKHGGRDDQLSRRIRGLDRYRVQALAKLLEAGDLEEADAGAVRQVMAEKARIFAAGARKRGRQKEAEEILALAGAPEDTFV